MEANMTALTIPAERTTLTLDEFLALPEHDENGNFFELSEGKLLKVSPTGYPHARRMAVIADVLFHVLDRTKYDIIGGEAGIIMAGDPKATVRGMDLAVVPKENAVAQGMLRTAPVLIVEVLSPSNETEDMEQKRKQYLDFGVPEVWFVYERTKTIHVYGPLSQARIVTYPEKLESAALNLTFAAEDLFQ
jgi:Uma2 family endonuclease